ncbi:MAG TPA: FecR family protein, partial [Burkholderiales bacterium]|nr:FecR family protein [Burkholderiales bacterium]
MNVARLLVAFCLAFCAVAARAGTAGQVMFAYGETHALRAGRIVHLIAGASVESGDQLHTGADSYLQVRFTDWGVMSLRPRTDFVIDEYEYEQRQGGIERAFFSLIAGGVRSLTGLIGHRDRSHYRLRTRMTAIGIRGTHYSVLLCQQDCRNEDGSLGEDGVYGGVIEGRIAVSPYGGTALEREFGAGEYFRLADENSIPMPLFTPPPFFWDPREPQSRAGGRTFAAVPWKPAPSLPPAAG